MNDDDLEDIDTLRSHIQALADAEVARVLEHVEATSTSTAGPPSIDAELVTLRRREQLRQAALAFGVRARALEYVTWRGEAVFDLVDGRLSARDGARDPRDPLVALDVSVWLEQLRRDEPFAFDAQQNH